MICKQCGNDMGDALQCPFCGAPIPSEFRYPTPQGTEYGAPAQEHENASAGDAENVIPNSDFFSALNGMPRKFLQCFTSPVSLLRDVMLGHDIWTGMLGLMAVLAFAFLGGLIFTRTSMKIIYGIVGSVTHTAMAATSAGMNQGMTYIAARIGPAAGGIAAMCSLIYTIGSIGIYILWLCVIGNVMFSRELIFGLLAMDTIPHAAFLLAGMLGCVISPVAGAVVFITGLVFRTVHLTGLFHALTGQSDDILLHGKRVCAVLATAVSLAICLLAGSALFASLWQRMMVLVTNVGSLL